MARMKFLCDAERCIECNGCVTACKQEHEIPWGVNRRRVVTINDGVPGERSISVACMHCSDAPCMAVCPVDCFYRTGEGVVLHDKDLCIGCGYCFYACPVRGAAVPAGRARSACAARWTSARSAPGGPETDMSEAEFKKYGRNRLAEGKLPACAEMCATKALLGGDGDVLAGIYRERVTVRGKGGDVWGWATAYGRPGAAPVPAPAGAPAKANHEARPVHARVAGRDRAGPRRVRGAPAGRHVQAGHLPGQAGHASLFERPVQRQRAAVGRARSARATSRRTSISSAEETVMYRQEQRGGWV
jgi:formate dehydrogenase iron-sulfur subunit